MISGRGHKHRADTAHGPSIEDISKCPLAVREYILDLEYEVSTLKFTPVPPKNQMPSVIDYDIDIDRSAIYMCFKYKSLYGFGAVHYSDWYRSRRSAAREYFENIDTTRIRKKMLNGAISQVVDANETQSGDLRSLRTIYQLQRPLA